MAERYQLQEFALQQLDNSSSSSKPRLNVGQAIRLRVERTEPQFGVITKLEADTVYVNHLETYFNSHMHAFQIVATDVVLVSAVLDNSLYPIAIHTDMNGVKCVCPRHVIY